MFILAYALNLVDDEKNVNLTGAEVITALVKRELVRIRKEEAASNYPPKTLEILIALSAISDGFTKDQLSSFAQEMELDEFELKSCETLTYWKSAETDNSGNINPGKLVPIEPDLLAAALLSTTLSDNENAGKFLYAALACAEDIKNALSMLARMDYDAEHIVACPLPLGSLRAYCLQDSERCSKINAGFNRVVIENNLLDLSIALNEKLLVEESDERIRAGLLTSLSLRLADAARREERLDAIERTVVIDENLAAEKFTAYDPNLASSMKIFSLRLADAGRYEEVLDAIERTVVIYRDLATKNFAAYGPALASSLNNLSIRLANIGRPKEGVDAIERVVEIYEKLATTNFAAYGPNLVVSLWLKSHRLEELSDFQSAYELALRAAEFIGFFAKADTRWQDWSDAIQVDLQRLEEKRKGDNNSA